MQNIVSEICDIIKSNELKDIVILTPSQVLSKRLVALCAKREKVMLGVTGSTPLLFAKEVCAPVLYAKAAPTLMEKGQVEDVVLDCLNKATGKGVFDHSRERATAAIMKDIIAELDENCVDNKELIEQVNNARTEAIATIRQAYEETKKQENLWDNADVLKEAVEQLKNTNEYDNTVFITLNCFKFSKLEELLVAQLNKVSVIDVNIPEVQAVAEKAEGFKCRSTEVEVRRILKDILEKDYPADDCAVVYLTNDYADALLTECELYGINASIYGGVSFTSNRYYHMYKALQEWKQAKPITKKRFDGKYSSYAYNAEVLCRLLANNALPMKNSGYFIKLLREYKAGWGKERYEQLLDVAAAEAKEALVKKENIDKEPDESKKIKLSPKEELLVKCAEEIPTWKLSVQKFIAVAAEEGTLEEQKCALLEVLNGANQYDPSAYSIIKKAINSITYLQDGETALGRLLLLLQGTTYRSQSEGSGKLLCAPLKQALFTGRKHLYICGMSRFALQGNRNECPLLLDVEKSSLCLKTLADYEKENIQALLMLLSEDYTGSQISYNYFDTEKMIELQPAPILRELQKGEPENIDYVADDIKLMVADYVKNDVLLENKTTALPQPAIPGLKEYIEKKVYSPSALETAIACPFKFFMEKVLGLKPYQEPVSNEDSWLESNEFGSLVHDVLDKYYDNKIKNKEDIRDFAEDVLEKELSAAVNRLKQNKPLTKDSAMKADIDNARAMIKRAIDWTTENVNSILATEQKFGAYFNAPVIKVGLSDTLEISIQGSIDRVETRTDENGKIQTFVLDYKSGKEYDEAKLETRLQPLLYSLAAKELEKQKGNNIEVYAASYLFLKDKVVKKDIPQDIPWDGSSRAKKLKMLESLIKEWLMKEDKIMTRCPAFTIDQDGSISGLGTAEQRKAAQKDCYCDSCEFNAFCKAILNEVEEGEDADD